MTGRGGRVLSALALAAFAAGCGAGRGGFAPSRDVCAPALPLANDTVHDRGTLVYVQQRKAADLRKLFGVPSRPLPPTVAARLERHTACLFVYRDSYPPGGVTGTPDGGTYALVEVTTRHPRVVRVEVTNQLPAGVPGHLGRHGGVKAR